MIHRENLIDLFSRPEKPVELPDADDGDNKDDDNEIDPNKIDEEMDNRVRGKQYRQMERKLKRILGN